MQRENEQNTVLINRCDKIVAAKSSRFQMHEKTNVINSIHLFTEFWLPFNHTKNHIDLDIDCSMSIAFYSFWTHEHFII